jgi:hypothetical protein
VEVTLSKSEHEKTGRAKEQVKKKRRLKRWIGIRVRKTEVRVDPDADENESSGRSDKPRVSGIQPGCFFSDPSQ